MVVRLEDGEGGRLGAPGQYPQLWHGGPCAVQGGVATHTMMTQMVDIFLLSIYLLATYQPFASPLYHCRFWMSALNELSFKMQFSPRKIKRTRTE